MDETTTNEIEKVREEARTRTRHGAYVYLIMIVTVLLAASATLITERILTERAIHESERKLCAIVILSDDAYRQNPPPSETGKALARNFSTLRRDLGCEPYRGA